MLFRSLKRKPNNTWQLNTLLMHLQFHKDNFKQLCNSLAKREVIFKNIIQTHGYPPIWTRPASFTTLIHIILEQQVSLASAKAALNKLKEKIGTITPAKVLALTDSEMKACYFSRQKMVYARELASAVITKKIQLKKLKQYPDNEIRMMLQQVKGIGDWTADVYLLFSLQRTDIFPIGDLAMVNSLKHEIQATTNISKDQLLALSEAWRPHRSIATILLWHSYLSRRNK